MEKEVKKYGIIADGDFVQSKSGKFSKIVNPATKEILAEVSSANKEDVDILVNSCEKAFESWKKQSRDYRSKMLYKIADMMEQNSEYFAKIETMNTGKCFFESMLQMDICAKQYRYFASCIQAHEDAMVQHEDGSFSMMVMEPLGVVALVLPWNAPSMLMSWKLAPALAAGNCVIIKPASNAPLPVLEIAKKFQEILPPGVLNVITGSGGEVGDYLINHPKISKISFTGSTEVGCGVGQNAAKNIIPCTLELGGKSANIVFSDANIDRAVQFSIIGILSTAGEVCVAGSRLFLQAEIYDEFVGKLKEKFEAVKVGNPLLPDVKMGPVIDEKQMNSVLGYIEMGKKEGARIVCGGKRLTGGEYDNGYYIEPTLFADVKNDMRIAQEEIFGPVLTVIKFDNEEDAIRMANDSDYGLGAAVWTKDINRAMRVSHSLQAGIVWVNDYLNSAHGGSFGGYKKSGLGREIHKVALQYYSQLKNICISTSEDVPPAF